MKSRNIIFLIAIILLADQVFKFYIKTHFALGDEIKVGGLEWFKLHFVENEGMAWGWKMGGEWGKIALTLFRLIAVIFGVFIIRDFIKKKHHKGFIICSALIFAGALGNLIDSVFYGLFFQESNMNLHNVAKLVPMGQGYAGLLHGKVVDMLYFPIIRDAYFPEWVPFWGGDEFEFFRPVFNIADASISVGVITILLFQNKFFKKPEHEKHVTVETNATLDDNVQVQ